MVLLQSCHFVATHANRMSVVGCLTSATELAWRVLILALAETVPMELFSKFNIVILDTLILQIYNLDDKNI